MQCLSAQVKCDAELESALNKPVNWNMAAVDPVNTKS